MASPTPPEPLPPTRAQAYGAWEQLWVPCVVFAHVFAGIWLVQAYLMVNPLPLLGPLRLWRRWRRQRDSNCTAKGSLDDGTAAGVCALGQAGRHPLRLTARPQTHPRALCMQMCGLPDPLLQLGA